MKNTPENKAKFFALYWGQNVHYLDTKDEGDTILKRSVPFCGTTPGYWGVIQFGWLNLKPLSQISDEDALHIGNIIYSDEVSNEDKIKDGLDWVKHSFCDELIPSWRLDELREFDDTETFISTIDYLRSKGYALPFMGISVDTLQEWNWVKLKDSD